MAYLVIWMTKHCTAMKTQSLFPLYHRLLAMGTESCLASYSAYKMSNLSLNILPCPPLAFCSKTSPTWQTGYSGNFDFTFSRFYLLSFCPLSPHPFMHITFTVTKNIKYSTAILYILTHLDKFTRKKTDILQQKWLKHVQLQYTMPSTEPFPIPHPTITSMDWQDWLITKLNYYTETIRTNPGSKAF